MFVMGSHIVRALSVAAIALTVSVCHDPNRYEPLSPTNSHGLDPDSVLALGADQLSVPADGVSRTKIHARLDPAATIRTVAFTTSLGTLLANGQTAAASAGTLSVTADATGVATVELRSAAEVSTARITATVTVAAVGTTPARTITRTLDISFVTVSADQLVVLEVSRSSLPADGFSTATITATLKFAGDLQKDVTFTTSRGTLVKFGAGPGDAGTVVRADATGVARIQLRSDTTVGTARVTATALGFEREVFVTFAAVDPGQVITVQPDASELPADGATRTRIVARVSPDLPETNRTVVFTTTDGSFTSGRIDNDPRRAQVKADASNLAIIELTSPSTAALASITATASNVTARTSINFVRAVPENLLLSVSDTTVDRTGSDSVTITAKLWRNTGTVAANTLVTFEARDAGGAVVGSFTPATVVVAGPDPEDDSHTRQRAVATFNPEDTAMLGVATIKVRVEGLERTVTVRIN